MSVACMTWVFTHSKAAGSDRLLLLAIADTADDSGGNAWPAVPTLARKTGISVRSVQRGIQRLAAAGYLTVDRGAGRGGTNRYQVVMPVAGGANLTPPVEESPARSPRQSDTSGAVTTPVTQLRHRGGDTQVSPERPRTSKNPPNPPASRGAKCDPVSQPHPRCRGCRTTPRQLAAAETAADAVQAQADLEDLVQRRGDVDWCGDPECDPQERRLMTPRGLTKCPNCHPDLVVGPLPTSRPLTVVGAR